MYNRCLAWLPAAYRVAGSAQRGSLRIDVDDDHGISLAALEHHLRTAVVELPPEPVVLIVSVIQMGKILIVQHDPVSPVPFVAYTEMAIRSIAAEQDAVAQEVTTTGLPVMCLPCPTPPITSMPMIPY